MAHTLVVDLDGTLLRSDMLFETFWSALSKDITSSFKAISALNRGKADLKRYLAKAATIEVPTLPYDPEVIAYIKAWRETGGQTALVTASDQKLADDIADHLGIFDAVHGSDGRVNLKGAEKAAFLTSTFGDGKFTYMGDSSADLEVWKHAARAITVNAPAALQAKAAEIAPEVEHLETQSRAFKPYLKGLRPHQWMKNILVFLPMLSAHQFDAKTLALTLLAFLSFSLVASSVYVLNDLLDLAADRAHPRKRNRPFAAGRIPIAHGIWMAAGTLMLGSLIALNVGWGFFCVMVGYYFLTLGYSLSFKQKMVVDICVLAGLYTIRIGAGAAATGIPLSVWLLAFSIFFFLSLAAVKRQAELVDNMARGKLVPSGRGYTVDDLPIISMVTISAGYVAVLVMVLYVNSPNVIELYNHPETLWGVCAVLLYWITRTVMLTHRGHMNDDPVIYAIKDRQSQICFLIILVLVLAGGLV